MIGTAVMSRTAEIKRESKETKISVSLSLDGTGEAAVTSGIPFFDHLLESACRHGYFDLQLKCEGDTDIDAHHSIEDCGIVLGRAFREASCVPGIKRFGSAVIPMDEALVRAAVDICGRPHLTYAVGLQDLCIDRLNGLVFREFFRGFVNDAGITLHISLLEGDEPHHCLEATFKSFGIAMDKALQSEPRCKGTPSSKGMLD